MMLKSLPEEIKTTDRILAQDYQLLADLGLPLKDKRERGLIPAFVFSLHGNNCLTPYLAAACQCFYLFFRFHTALNEETRKNILLGDYFFSRFLELLLLSNNYQLLSYFCQYVTEKCQDQNFAEHFSQYELLPLIQTVCKESQKGKNKEEPAPLRTPQEETFPLRKMKPVM